MNAARIRASGALLKAIEAALPTYTSGERIDARTVHRKFPRYSWESIRRALYDLAKQGRAIATGGRKERLYSRPETNKLRAVARPQEGAAAASQPSSLVQTAAGKHLPVGHASATIADTPAASLEAPRKLKNGEYPPASEIRALMAQGLGEELIGKRYGRSVKWAQAVKKLYGIRSRKKPAPAAAPALPRVDNQIVRPDAPVPVERPSQSARYAAYFAAHGPYPSFTETQIARFERRWAIAHPTRAPGVIDVAPALYGDPAPGRAA